MLTVLINIFYAFGEVLTTDINSITRTKNNVTNNPVDKVFQSSNKFGYCFLTRRFFFPVIHFWAKYVKYFFFNFLWLIWDKYSRVWNKCSPLNKRSPWKFGEKNKCCPIYTLYYLLYSCEF